MPETAPRDLLREWGLEAFVLVAVVALGWHQAATAYLGPRHRLLLLGCLVATAVGAALFRRAPGIALGLVWATCLVEVVAPLPVLLVQVATALVAFGTARWGRTSVLVASALSIPVAAIITTQFSRLTLYRAVIDAVGSRAFFDAVLRLGQLGYVAGLVVFPALLAVPWALGLAMRFRARALEARTAELLAQAEAERAQLASTQAQEIGRLQEDQARLARDVHDVVGHSLAVILAQAESAQFLADDPARLKETMATIATSARASLQDVRQVLAAPEEQVAPRLGGLDALIDGVRSSGHVVESTEEGQRPPLPPDLDVVAHRVLQELLTNAITHGRRDRPVLVERTWPSAGSPDLLRLRVRNTMGTPSESTGGNGVPGMRRRLEAVGGRLDLRQDDDVFTATAWIPVRLTRTTGSRP